MVFNSINKIFIEGMHYKKSYEDGPHAIMSAHPVMHMQRLTCCLITLQKQKSEINAISISILRRLVVYVLEITLI